MVPADKAREAALLPRHDSEYSKRAKELRESANQSRDGDNRIMLLEAALIFDRLAQAKHHIDEALATVMRQVELVEELEIRGIDATEATRLLTEFRRFLIQHIQDCDRILTELGLPPENRPI